MAGWAWARALTGVDDNGERAAQQGGRRCTNGIAPPRYGAPRHRLQECPPLDWGWTWSGAEGVGARADRPVSPLQLDSGRVVMPRLFDFYAPVFTFGLALDAPSTALAAPLTGGEAQQRARRLLDRARSAALAAGKPLRQVESAGFALVAWFDELMARHPRWADSAAPLQMPAAMAAQRLRTKRRWRCVCCIARGFPLAEV